MAAASSGHLAHDPMSDEPSQLDLFARPPSDGKDGYILWQQERDGVAQELARVTGLPLNHPVEVFLRDGVRLEGRLRLSEERLFLESRDARSVLLTVDGVSFRPSEIERCLRLD